LVGSGTVVTKDISEKEIVVGNPGKVLRKRTDV
jgi:acetyltransferase-like isoleucine patch superfamily enzyme